MCADGVGGSAVAGMQGRREDFGRAGFGGVFVEGGVEDCVLVSRSNMGGVIIGVPFFCLTSMPPCSFLEDMSVLDWRMRDAFNCSG